MNDSVQLFVSAIGTDSGKTIVSALLTHMLEANYWKAIQAGVPWDRDTIERLGRPNCTIHPSAYVLRNAESPHSAAEKEQVEIQSDTIIKKMPADRNLVVEGAGGLLVPMNNSDTIADVIKQLGIPLVLVADYYLGSINHTLLSLAYCKHAQLPLKGLIMNGPKEKGTFEIIQKKSHVPILLEVPHFDELNQQALSDFAKKHQNSFVKSY